VPAGLLFDAERLGAWEAAGHGIDGADGVDAVAVVVAGAALEEVGGLGRELADAGEEVAIAGLGEGGDLFLFAAAGEIVAVAGEQLGEAFAHLALQRAIGEEGVD